MVPQGLAWLIAFALYKPAAAIVYAVAFDLAGQQGALALLDGVMMLVLAILALPALLRFVVPATSALAGGWRGRSDARRRGGRRDRDADADRRRGGRLDAPASAYGQAQTAAAPVGRRARRRGGPAAAAGTNGGAGRPAAGGERTAAAARPGSAGPHRRGAPAARAGTAGRGASYAAARRAAAGAAAQPRWAAARRVRERWFRRTGRPRTPRGRGGVRQRGRRRWDGADGRVRDAATNRRERDGGRELRLSVRTGTGGGRGRRVCGISG